jgi:Domain of unknown function (DUF4340)
VNGRSLLVVAVIAALCVVLAFFATRPDDSVSDAGALLVPELAESLNSVQSVRIIGAGNQPVATLERGADGWSVAEKGGYAADVVKLRQALIALSEARIVEEKTSNPDYYDRLGVQPIDAEGATGVAIAITAGDTTLPQLILGDPVNNAGRYVRRADEATSFLIDRNPDVPNATAQWLTTEIVDVPSADVASVTISHADGESVRISKSSADEANFSVADIPDGRELLYPGVANVIANALRELKLDDVAANSADAVTPDVTSEFVTFDGLVVTLTGRAIDGDNWITIAASYAADSAPPPADEQPADETTPADAPGSATAEADEGAAQPAADPSARADAINARVAGWRYRIPAHLYDQATRRMSDLLKAPE